MNEVEVKARVADVNALKKRFEDEGCVFSEPIIQRDIILLQDFVDIMVVNEGEFVTRIRNSNGKIVLTVKKQLNVELASAEREILIDDAEKGVQLLNILGFNEVVRVNKTRWKSKYKGLTVCVDEVETLGGFVELEKMTDESDFAVIQDELFQILESFGVKKEDRVEMGYDKLMYIEQKK